MLEREVFVSLCASSTFATHRHATPTRYESVGCDEGRFIFPEEFYSI